MDSNHVEKIKKLLALAQSDNQNERDLALAKAAAFAAEHDIDVALIDVSDVGQIKEEPIIRHDFTHRPMRRRPVEHRFIANILMVHFKVDIVWRRHAEWTFIGRKTDVEFAKWLCGFLLEEFPRRWKTYCANNADQTVGYSMAPYRNTFMLGLRDGLSKKLRAAKSEVESAKLSSAESRSKYALVIQDEKARRQSAMETFFPRLRTFRSSGVRVRNHNVHGAGVAHGATISCNRPLV